MINLEKKYLNLIKEILQIHIPDERVWLFGSRVTESVKPFSDIDLVILNQNPLSPSKRANLSSAFSESDLPYKVDVVEWCRITEAFKNIISQQHEVVQE